MSTDPNIFMAEVDAMLAAADERMNDIAVAWMGYSVDFFIEDVAGPGNQHEPGEYIATGRLRASFNWSSIEPPEETSRFEGGPFDDTQGGIGVRARLKAEIQEMPAVSPEMWLWSDIAYFYLVHEGRGPHAHIGRRPSADLTAGRSAEFLQRAIDGNVRA